MTAAASLALEVEAVDKAFPGTVALDDMSLRIRRGEVHALVGQNGSGKSTLIKILAGFYSPDSYSRAAVMGQEFQLGDSGSASSVGLRFVHQDLGLVAEMDAVDNMAMGYGFETSFGGRVRWRSQVRTTRQAIRDLGHDFDVRMPVAALSPGERTTVAIARALQDWQGKASLLVLDEPTSVMPEGEIRRLFTVIKRVTERGIGVLYVSHRLGEVLEIADQVTVLRDGHAFDPVEASGLTRRAIVQLMTGSVVDEQIGEHAAVAGEEALVVRGLRGSLLTNLDVTVHKGEIVGVSGLTGSGRDEVCGLIFGSSSREGSVSLAGDALPSGRPDISVERSVGFVPADRHARGLVLSFNIKENLTLPRLREFWKRLFWKHRREQEAATDWMRRLNIKARDVNDGVASLSGGNQQKVVIGKWLRLAPRVLLLEEPTQGVDVAARAEIHRLIEQAALEGAAVLVTSSDEDELARLCDRVLILSDGVKTAELAGPAITTTRIVQLTLGTDEPVASSNSAVEEWQGVDLG